MANWMEQLSWLLVGNPENPYSFEVLDCRAACAALTLSQSEMGPEAVASIEQVAQSSPSTLVPAEDLSSACSMSISSSGAPITHHAFTPPGQGHKWLLEIVDQTILARRRWTGQLVHVAEFEVHDARLIIKRLTSERQLVYGNAEYAVAEMEFLLKTYFEGADCAFPIPPGLNRNDTSKIALSGWKAHGPVARFARFL
jgi:hypothetical protein